ncbi:MAG: polysaccharide deacetylase family protein [Bacteroidia bacterium]
MYIVRPSFLLRKIYPKAIWRVPLKEKKIFLTFDDGPVPIITPWILDLLKRFEIKATFFCVGENVAKYPEIYQRLLNEKHAVGNHTYNHLNGWNSHSKTYIKNVKKCADVVDSKLFRPPYGRAKKSQIEHLSHQYSIIMWDVLSGDYDKNTSQEKCLKNVTDNVRNGSIIVFHDNIKAQKNLQYALPLFLDWAKQQGFIFEVLK